mgnify:CR=1 FL=1
MTFYSTKVFSASAVDSGRIELLSPVSGQNVVLDSINLNFGVTGVGATGVATVFAVTANSQVTASDNGDILFQWHVFDESRAASYHNPGVTSTGGSKTVPQGLVLAIYNTPDAQATYVVTCGYRDATKY